MEWVSGSTIYLELQLYMTLALVGTCKNKCIFTPNFVAAATGFGVTFKLFKTMFCPIAMIRRINAIIIGRDV